MGLFSKIIFKDKVKRILAGVLDAVPIVSTIKANVTSEGGGFGKLDWLRIVTAIGTFALILAFVKGWITMEELTQLLKLVK